MTCRIYGGTPPCPDADDTCRTECETIDDLRAKVADWQLMAERLAAALFVRGATAADCDALDAWMDTPWTSDEAR